MNNVVTVSGLNLYVKMLLESDRRLKNIWLKGEISNLTNHYRSGHIYLTLKDERSAVKAVMFAGHAARLQFRPQNGMKVLVRGNITLYEATGSYQISIEEMKPDGAGALNLAFEQLKARLQSEGLFDQAHKKPLPRYPRRIGVITSPTGAAVQDIMRILKRRYPLGEVIMCPVMVQGGNAAAELTEAVRKFDRLACADVIIIGRGGGSAEDLWAFNDEALAYAVYECRIPVVSAVGHETDFTICDFVSDVRASTPSAGAELVSPDIDTLRADVSFYDERLREAIQSRLLQEKTRLHRLQNTRVLRSPQDLTDYRKMKLQMLSNRLTAGFSQCCAKEQKRFTAVSAKLEILSPLKVLARGYAIAKKEEQIICSVRQAKAGDSITVVLQDGTLTGKVTERNENLRG